MVRNDHDATRATLGAPTTSAGPPTDAPVGLMPHASSLPLWAAGAAWGAWLVFLGWMAWARMNGR